MWDCPCGSKLAALTSLHKPCSTVNSGSALHTSDVMKCSIRNIRNIRNNVVFGLRAVAGNDSGCGDSYMDTRVIGVLQSLVTDQRCDHVLLDCAHAGANPRRSYPSRTVTACTLKGITSPPTSNIERGFVAVTSVGDVGGNTAENPCIRLSHTCHLEDAHW